MLHTFLLIGAVIAIIIAFLMLLMTFYKQHRIIRAIIQKQAVSAAEQNALWEGIGTGCMYLCLGLYGISTQIGASGFMTSVAQGLLLILAVILGIHFVILRRNNE